MAFDATFHYEEAKKMDYRRLGQTDMVVSKLGLGAASFGKRIFLLESPKYF